MDQESQERFRQIEELVLKVAVNDLASRQRVDRLEKQMENNNILLDQLVQSQLRLEASNEELRAATEESRRRTSHLEKMTAEIRASTEELKAATEESRRRELRLEDLAVDHHRVLRIHEGRIKQIENAA